MANITELDLFLRIYSDGHEISRITDKVQLDGRGFLDRNEMLHLAPEIKARIYRAINQYIGELISAKKARLDGKI